MISNETLRDRAIFALYIDAVLDDYKNERADREDCIRALMHPIKALIDGNYQELILYIESQLKQYGKERK